MTSLIGGITVYVSSNIVMCFVCTSNSRFSLYTVNVDIVSSLVFCFYSSL